VKHNYVLMMNVSFRKHWADLIFLSFYVFVILLYVFGQSNSHLLGTVGYITVTPLATLTLVISFYLFKSSEKSGLQRAFLGFFIGFLLWFIGEITWDFYTTLFGVVAPYPSMADLNWILGYPFIGYGLLNLLGRNRSVLTGFMKALWALSGFVTFSVIGYFLLIPILSEADFATLFFDLAYPLLDSVLLFLSMGVLIVLWDSTYGFAWLPIPASFFIEAVADLSFTYLILQDAYFVGHPVDALFALAYLTFIFGNFKIRGQIQVFQNFFTLKRTSFHVDEGESVVALYTAEANKMKVFASYIREGLLNGDKVYYVFPNSDAGLVKEVLKEEGVGVESIVKNGSLTLVPASQWRNGVYGAETVDRGMLRMMEEAKRNGYKHLRTLVDYGDIHQMFKDSKDFFAEAIRKTDEKYRQLYLIQLITFNAESLSEEEIQQLRQFHVKSLYITESFSIEKLEAFSRRLGLRHKELVGRKVFFELDVTSNYEEAVEAFVFESQANDEPVVVFTHRGSGLHSALTPRRAIRFFHLTPQVSVPTAGDSENEILLPINNTSLLLDTLDKTLKACPQGNISIVFDNLSDLILSIGFEKTYNFLHFTLEIIAPETVTALFLLNPNAHEPEVASSLRSLFNSQITYGKRGLEVIKLPKF